MSKKYIIIFAAIISLLFVSVIWQFAETKIILLLEQASTKMLGKPVNQITVLDDEGIPMQLYHDGQKHYNPLFIARAAQKANLHRRLTDESEDFIKLSNWLLNHLSESDSTCLALYDFDYPKYGQKAPWSSALTQAVLMNVLAARAGMQRDLKIYDKAKRSLYSLSPQVAGLTYVLSDSSYWYMEYPAAEPYFVLNGMLSCLIELHAYHELTGDPLAQNLFDKGFNALIQKLPEFDYHGYSYYDLKGNKASRAYHQTHIKQLTKLLELRNNNLILHYRNRWQKADSYPVLWQMLLNPRPKRVLVFILAFAGLAVLIYLLLAWTQRKAPDDPDHS